MSQMRRDRLSLHQRYEKKDVLWALLQNKTDKYTLGATDNHENLESI